MQTKQDLIQWLEDNKDQFHAISDDIWANPELGWEEYFASARQADFLAEKGFTVYSIADIPTAFIAEWGEGTPVIGFVGEYDALPGLSQKVGTAQEPLKDGAAGHGCGHNMLGTAGVASAVAIKEWLQATGKPGKVRYYGCPAEENGDPKAHMALAGAYDDMAVAFNFHPGTINMAGKGSSIGVYDAYFRFHGRTSHAGGSPHLGRSALDAVELMNIGVNYLREHVLPSVRMHYTITKGGQAPNIVPDLAEVWYFLRAHQPDEMQDLVERVRKVAKGAAMMTETKVEEIFNSTVSSVLNSHSLSDLQYEAMQVVGEIPFTEEEIAFARQINANYDPVIVEDSVKYKVGQLRVPEDEARQPLLTKNYAATDEKRVGGGSTDVGDLSWNVPVSMLSTTCWPSGVPGHSWGNVAAGGMSIGHKGMMHAAKIMAVAAMDCFSDPVHIQKAQEEFDAKTKKRGYISMIPDGVTKPPIKFNEPEDSLPKRYPQCPFYNRG